MWKALSSFFQHCTLLNKTNAPHRFYTAKVDDEERVRTHISRMRQLALDLQSMCKVVADDNSAMNVLCGLSERFEHINVAIDTVSSSRELSLDFVRSRLLEEHQKVFEREKRTSKPSVALVSEQTSRKHWDYCKRNDHTERYC